MAQPHGPPPPFPRICIHTCTHLRPLKMYCNSDAAARVSRTRTNWGPSADGAVNADVFEAFVEQVLVPDLREGDVVVMDNLSSHKRSKSGS